MVKSFINAFFGGMGRTLGKVLIYFAIGLIFFLIYDNANAAAIYGPNSCTSTHYRIIKNDEYSTDTFGVTSTTYNIPWAVISFYGTENMTSNTYYDIKVTFINNLPTNFIRNVEFYQTNSLCGSQSGEFQVSSFTQSGKVLTFRVLTGLNLVDYWQSWITLSGVTNSNGISSVVLSKVDMSGSEGIIENNNNNTNSIINNNNENTQDVIDNQNQNTQDVIDNQNQNTQDIISNQTCPVGPLSITRDEWGTNRGYVLGSDGSLVAMGGNDITTYFLVKPNTEYTIVTSGGAINSNLHYCFYNSSKSLINCNSYNSGSSATNTFTTTQYVQYLRISIQSSRTFTLTGPVCNDWDKEAINNLNDTQKDTNDLLSDDSDGDTSIFSTWWDNYEPLSNPLGNVITLPINLAQKIVSFNDSSCQTVNLGNLLGHDLSLTCFSLSSVLPDNSTSLINTIDIIMSVSLLVVIIKNTYETIANLISLGGENEVKKQFRLPTPLEFLAYLLNGGGN